VRLVTVSELNPVQAIWFRWWSEGHRFAAPRLLRYEVTNALHRLRRFGELSDRAAQAALRVALDQPIQLYDDELLHPRALELSSRFNRPATYDAHYLALAEHLSCDFWTIDERLYNATHHQLPWVRLVGATS
jgi:predicted nucleic acid-binding protein